MVSHKSIDIAGTDIPLHVSVIVAIVVLIRIGQFESFKLVLKKIEWRSYGHLWLIRINPINNFFGFSNGLGDH